MKWQECWQWFVGTTLKLTCVRVRKMVTSLQRRRNSNLLQRRTLAIVGYIFVLICWSLNWTRFSLVSGARGLGTPSNTRGRASERRTKKNSYSLSDLLNLWPFSPCRWCSCPPSPSCSPPSRSCRRTRRGRATSRSSWPSSTSSTTLSSSSSPLSTSSGCSSARSRRSLSRTQWTW